LLRVLLSLLLTTSPPWREFPFLQMPIGFAIDPNENRNSPERRGVRMAKGASELTNVDVRTVKDKAFIIRREGDSEGLWFGFKFMSAIPFFSLVFQHRIGHIVKTGSLKDCSVMMAAHTILRTFMKQMPECKRRIRDMEETRMLVSLFRGEQTTRESSSHPALPRKPLA